MEYMFYSCAWFLVSNANESVLVVAYGLGFSNMSFKKAQVT